MQGSRTWRLVLLQLAIILFVCASLIGWGVYSTNRDNAIARQPRAAAFNIKKDPKQPIKKPTTTSDENYDIAKFIAVATFIVIVCQSYIAAKQVGVAERQANIMGEQAVIMDQQKQILLKQTEDNIRLQRAIMIGSTRPHMITNIVDDNIIRYFFQPTFLNSGKTAALDVRVIRGFNAFDASGMPLDFKFPRPEKTASSIGPIGVDDRVLADMYRLTAEEVQGITEETSRYYIWAVCEYRNIFSHSSLFYTRSCSEITRMSDFLNMPIQEQTKMLRTSKGEPPIFAFRIGPVGNDSGEYAE